MTTHVQIRELDVCLLTRHDPSPDWLNRLSYLPLRKLIVETSSPLGLARMRAINKVETDWFVFIDDDVFLGPKWFNQLSKLASSDIGVVQGAMHNIGLGHWDQIGNRPITPYRLELGDRGFTHNTLIRTDLVRDWKPSHPELSAWEDYEITQHILRKGYDWIVGPVDAYHLRGFGKKWGNIVWATRGWRDVTNPSSYTIIREFLRHLLGIPYMCFKVFIIGDSWQIPYWAFVNSAHVWGLLHTS